MPSMKQRLERERRIMEAQFQLYCQEWHGGGQKLCAECAELRRYLAEQMENCVLRSEKPTCTRCAFRCFAPEQHVRMKSIVRHAGSRLFWRFPLLYLRHAFDTRYTPAR